MTPLKMICVFQLLLRKALGNKKNIVCIFVDPTKQNMPKLIQFSNFPLKIQMSLNEFLIEKYKNLKVNVKMYMSEISKSKVSDLKAQKIIILWTLKHVSAISKLPV